MNEKEDDIQQEHPFDAETWAQLPNYFAELPNPVHLSVWGDANATIGEREAARLGRALAGRFPNIHYALYPRRANYPYYPVIGVMGIEGEEQIDYRVRIIGLPAGYQLTSLIAAIQAVAFRGVTLEPKTRLQLRGLQEAVSIEIMSDAQDEAGALVAKTAFGLAVASEHVRTFLIMADVFPEATIRYSISYLPHTVINNRYHVSGVIDEAEMMGHIAKALRPS